MPGNIGLLELDIVMPLTGSLKDKRQILRSIKDKVRQRFNVSIAEVRHLDSIRRTQLAVVTISNDRRYAEKQLQEIEKLVGLTSTIQVVDRLVSWL